MRRITLYTDGAVSGNGGPGRIGMAYVAWLEENPAAPKEKSWFEDREYATNNIAELLAMKGGLGRIRPELRGSFHITVVTDSEWAIRSLERKYRNTANLELLQDIRDLLAEFGSYELRWTPGHAGEQYNERVNMLAQQAAGTWKKRKRK